MKRVLKRVFGLATGVLLALGAKAATEIDTGHVVLTNVPGHGAKITINGDQRMWSTNVTNAATQIAVTNSIGWALTNLYVHLVSHENADVNAVQYGTNANELTLEAYGGTALSVTVASNWARVSYTTNGGSGSITVTVPPESESLEVRTNIASGVVGWVNDTNGTNVVNGDAPALGNFVNTTSSQTVSNKSLWESPVVSASAVLVPGMFESGEGDGNYFYGPAEFDDQTVYLMAPTFRVPSDDPLDYPVGSTNRVAVFDANGQLVRTRTVTPAQLEAFPVQLTGVNAALLQTSNQMRFGATNQNALSNAVTMLEAARVTNGTLTKVTTNLGVVLNPGVSIATLALSNNLVVRPTNNVLYFTYAPQEPCTICAIQGDFGDGDELWAQNLTEFNLTVANLSGATTAPPTNQIRTVGGVPMRIPVLGWMHFKYVLNIWMLVSPSSVYDTLVAPRLQVTGGGTNTPGQVWTAVSTDGSGAWSNAASGGASVVMGDAGVTNGSVVSVLGSTNGGTNLLRTLSGGNGIVLTNEGTNVSHAIDPSVVAGAANLTTVSNIAVQATNTASGGSNLAATAVQNLGGLATNLTVAMKTGSTNPALLILNTNGQRVVMVDTNTGNVFFGTNGLMVSNANGFAYFYVSNRFVGAINGANGFWGVLTNGPTSALHVGNGGSLSVDGTVTATTGFSTAQNSSLGGIVTRNASIYGAGSSAPGAMIFQNDAFNNCIGLLLGGTTAGNPAIGRTNGDLIVFGGDLSFSGGSTNKLVVQGREVLQSDLIFKAGFVSNTPPAGYAGVFAATNSGVSEMYGIDSGGNVTQLTSHPLDAPGIFYITTNWVSGAPHINRTVKLFSGTIEWENITMTHLVQRWTMDRDLGSTNYFTNLTVPQKNAITRAMHKEESFAAYNARTGGNLVRLNWAAVQAARQLEYDTARSNELAAFSRPFTNVVSVTNQGVVSLTTNVWPNNSNIVVRAAADVTEAKPGLVDWVAP